MKKAILSIISLSMLGHFAMAQDLPKPSPTAAVEQMVGLTEISIEYSRPGVKNRTIWGDLVPYNEIWRAGANKATQFELSNEAQIGGKTVPAGKYSLFIIPKEGKTWTVIINKETELWGASDYKQENDQLRFEATVSDVSNSMERLQFHFLDVTSNSATIAMDWEKKRMTFDVTTQPDKVALQNIEKALAEAKPEDKWKVYRNAASYAEEQGNMTDQGLEWIKKSVELKENWYAHLVYANLLSQKGMNKEAIEKAEKAIAIGVADAKANSKEFTFEKSIQEDIAKWKSAK